MTVCGPFEKIDGPNIARRLRGRNKTASWIWSTDQMFMDEQSNAYPIRRLLSRKSKPSMEDLVDHHRSTYWASPSSSTSNHLHGSNVNGDRVNVDPKVEDILGVLSDSDDSDDGERTLKEKEDVRDNLPLAYLYKCVVSPPPQSSALPVATTVPTTSVLCTAPRCHRPVVQSDDRWDGQFCSVECLLQVCHETFHTAFRDQSKLQQHQQQPEHYLTSTFKNSTGIFS
ncbi:hypothetical protein EGR_05025 [Echinococcus granulosus]|uniref:Uncharacterized protein n=1 Tax=Echinococcus granulosus TaxID=6210 RepID=W6UPI0_ECHGR|nr:hypothetical protein EGR_05025 [Echinococcus granulosus]EUB60172.1 hypothetical protein EGR_05025 [Echinococcus granulosus]